MRTSVGSSTSAVLETRGAGELSPTYEVALRDPSGLIHAGALERQSKNTRVSVGFDDGAVGVFDDDGLSREVIALFVLVRDSRIQRGFRGPGPMLGVREAECDLIAMGDTRVAVSEEGCSRPL